MDGFYLTLVFLMLLGLLYVLLSIRLTRGIETKFRETYKNQLQRDIQEFYREMESYAALVESRINRYKTLVERHESILTRWQELALELKKNKKTRDISEIIERSLEKERQIMATLAQVSRTLPPQEPEIKATTTKAEKPAANTTRHKTVSAKNFETPESTASVPIPELTVTPKQPIKPITHRAQHTTADSEFNFASEVLNSYDNQNHTPPESKTSDTPGTAPSALGKFGKVMLNLLLNQPQEQPKPSFAQLTPVPTVKEPTTDKKRTTTEVYQPPAPRSELKPSPIVKKIDPDELQILVERMRTEPGMRPALLKIMVDHNLPMPMVADLTGIELSQLEAIRKLYNI